MLLSQEKTISRENVYEEQNEGAPCRALVKIKIVCDKRDASSMLESHLPLAAQNYKKMVLLGREGNWTLSLAILYCIQALNKILSKKTFSWPRLPSQLRI